MEVKNKLKMYSKNISGMYATLIEDSKLAVPYMDILLNIASMNIIVITVFKKSVVFLFIDITFYNVYLIQSKFKCFIVNSGKPIFTD